MPLPSGVTSHTVDTPRLRTHYLERGPADGSVVVFVHGNVSSSRFYAETMAALPPSVRAIAPDMRGYGDSEVKPVDATRGVRDFADDILALLDVLDIAAAHFVGWSVGGGVIQQIAITAAERVLSLTLEASQSPYGFGGTKDLSGAPCFDDWAGTGGGTANPEFVASLAKGDTSADTYTSPRSILRAFYVKPPFAFPPELEDEYVAAMLKTTVGEGNYPGDLVASENWPTLAPGALGPNNAISGKHCDTSAMADISPQPPVMWVYGVDDQIVSDASLFDFGNLGKIGMVPGWPGDEVFPAQPMWGQIRAMLERYAAKGGSVREEPLADCGHSPHLEHQGRFVSLLVEHIGA